MDSLFIKIEEKKRSYMESASKYALWSQTMEELEAITIVVKNNITMPSFLKTKRTRIKQHKNP